MKIKLKMLFVNGEFDTLTDNLVAVPYHKRGKVEFEEVDELAPSIRDFKGFGSTGD